MSKSGSATSSRRDEGREPHQRRGLTLQRYTEYIDSIGSDGERQKREDVLSTIKSYLNLVSTPAKFITDDFLEFFSGCIAGFKSSMSCSDMDNVIAALCHLEDFSLRLIKEPWRHEFRVLKLYNSLFVTSILPFIDDAPKIFIFLGYQPDSSQSSTLTLLPSSSLDLKAVSAVACDLLLAASELSLMKTVLASLQSFHITLPADGDGASAKPISIHDVWKERKTNVGSAESSVERISTLYSSSPTSNHRDKVSLLSSPSPSRHLDSSDTGPLPRFPAVLKSRATTNLHSIASSLNPPSLNPPLNPSSSLNAPSITAISNTASFNASNNDSLFSLTRTPLNASVSLPSSNRDTQRCIYSLLTTPDATVTGQQQQQQQQRLLQQTQQYQQQQLLTGVGVGVLNGAGSSRLGDDQLSTTSRTDGRGGGGGVVFTSMRGVSPSTQRSSAPAGSLYGVEGGYGVREQVLLPDSNSDQRRSFYDNDDYGLASTDYSTQLLLKQQQQQQQQHPLTPNQILSSRPSQPNAHVYPSLLTTESVTAGASGIITGIGGVSASLVTEAAVTNGRNEFGVVTTRRAPIEIPIKIISSSNSLKPKAFSITKLSDPSPQSSSQRVTSSNLQQRQYQEQTARQQLQQPNPEHSPRQQRQSSPRVSPNFANTGNSIVQSNLTGAILGNSGAEADISGVFSGISGVNTGLGGVNAAIAGVNSVGFGANVGNGYGGASSCAECRSENESESDDDTIDRMGNFQRRSPTRDSYRNAIHSHQLMLGGGGGDDGGKHDLIEKFAELNVRAISQGISPPSVPPSTKATLPSSVNRAKSFSTQPRDSSTKQQPTSLSSGRNASSLRRPKTSASSLFSQSKTTSKHSTLGANGGPAPSSTSSGGGGAWTCASCTFVNPKSGNVCTMCDKSRKGASAGKENLKSGGHQCPQCTLVNDKGVLECNACGQNLIGCPTYI